METQSTVTDPIDEQVEHAQPAVEETLRESPRALTPSEPRVTETRDEEAVGAREEAPVLRRSEEIGGSEDAVGEPEELEGPSGQRLEVVVAEPPRVTVGVPRTPRMDMVLSANEGMLNAVQRCIVEVRAAFDNNEMTDVSAGRYYVCLANTIVRGN